MYRFLLRREILRRCLFSSGTRWDFDCGCPRSAKQRQESQGNRRYKSHDCHRNDQYRHKGQRSLCDPHYIKPCHRLGDEQIGGYWRRNEGDAQEQQHHQAELDRADAER